MTKPKLVQMAGFPGAGKTRIARYLSRKIGVPRILTGEKNPKIWREKLKAEQSAAGESL